MSALVPLKISRSPAQLIISKASVKAVFEMVPFEEQCTSKFFQENLKYNIILLDLSAGKKNIMVKSWKIVTL